MRLVNRLIRLLSLCTSMTLAVPILDLALVDFMGCLRRDILADQFGGLGWIALARVDFFDLILLAGSVSLATIHNLTCRFLACFLIGVVALCVTLGSSCSVTLGDDWALCVIECV